MSLAKNLMVGVILIIAAIAILIYINQHGIAKSITISSTTVLQSSTIPTTTIPIPAGNPSLTNVQAEVLVGSNATYSTTVFDTPAEVSGYRSNLALNAAAVWLTNYLNGSIVNPNWGIEQVVIYADTPQEAKTLYAQTWRSIIEPSQPPTPTNGTYDSMIYSYTSNSMLYRTAFVGVEGNYVSSIIISTDNTTLNITKLIHIVAGDLSSK